MDEFSIIQRFFTRPPRRPDVRLGVGDDAAWLAVGSGQGLVVAVDTLVEDVHFPADSPPGDIAHKALAVNLSDLAAMGATPAWFTLALTLPEPDAEWLGDFTAGLFALADRFGVELVGGDTTRGPCAVTVQVLGFADAVLTRAGARPGQAIMVTGSLGDAALALDLQLKGERVDPALLDRLNRPEPRVGFGLGLARIASAAIDISDGVYADLGHLLTASGCGATVELPRLPRSAAFDTRAPASPWRLLGGGDDYELCFTVDEARLAEVNHLAGATGLPVTRIGTIEASPGLRCVNEQGEIETIEGTGYDHFA